MKMTSLTIPSTNQAKVQNHPMLLFSHQSTACLFWPFHVIFAISPLDALNFVMCRDIFALCLVAIVALPNATFDWLNRLSVSASSFYDFCPIFDPNWRCHVIIVECLSLQFRLMVVVSTLVCFYDMLTGFVDDFLNGSNYDFKKLQIDEMFLNGIWLEKKRFFNEKFNFSISTFFRLFLHFWYIFFLFCQFRLASSNFCIFFSQLAYHSLTFDLLPYQKSAQQSLSEVVHLPKRPRKQ